MLRRVGQSGGTRGAALRIAVLTAFLVAAAGSPSGVSDAAAGPPAPRQLPFRSGMVVTESATIEPGIYEVAGPASLDEALIVVRGTGITLDLAGVYLRGLPVESDPDRAAGVAIRIDGGADVTIRNAHVRGHRFAVLARGTRNLRLIDNELSYGWKPRLYSLVGHESLVDWLSFHDNEDRQWMRFGAAIYLEDVEGGEIAGNRAVQGMNGLLMTRSDEITVRDNELTFNSGLGIGLYRSNRNTIVGNRLDYNVRGYSHGFYQRGQDSAAILLYEQSSNNVIAYNSATHSGDGLFLWAGQSTMNTGAGGANDNLILANDFSFAPTNGIEVTFSRNTIVGNRIEGSRYGVWGGYSWETVITGNCFAGNEVGVAIEHGQDNIIDRNVFAGDATAIELWANPVEPSDWGYPRHRDTRSRDHRVTRNVFAAHEQLWRLDDTTGLDISGNEIVEAIPETPCVAGRLSEQELASLVPDPAPEMREAPVSALARLHRSAIVVDEWGPYDWRSPKLWPLDTERSPVRLRVLGPPGDWRLRDRRGVAGVSAESGRTGDTLIVTPAAGSTGDWAVHLEYIGAATVSPRGTERPAGEPVPFSFERFEPTAEWSVRFFAWTDPAADPVPGPATGPAHDPGAFARLLESDPILTRTEPRLDYQWYRPAIAGLPQERWALEATATLDLPPGEYTLRAISDDGVRVWVDDSLLIDNWDEPHGSVVDQAPIAGGAHRLRVRYYQLGGWSELRLEVVRN
ncbi:MAG TPA: NosD domain-containing protein [Acidobacteriota bacterium]